MEGGGWRMEDAGQRVAALGRGGEEKKVKKSN